MNKVTRAEKILQNLTDNGSLSQNGREWLIAALDPMHDTALPHLSGWPDVCDAASVVRCHRESLQLSVPSTITSGTWDCVIQSMPILNARGVAGVSHYNNALVWGSYGSVRTVAPVTISAYQSGSSYSWATSSNAERFTIEIPASILTGSGRLIGMGIETTNTTAQINAQGTCTAYRQPQHARIKESLSYVGVNAIAYSSVPHPGQVMLAHPSSLKTAMALAGSRQWPASEGCYSVVPFLSSFNPVVQQTMDQPVVITDYSGFSTNSTTLTNADLYTTQFTTVGANNGPAYTANF